MAEDAKASHGALVELFERIEGFFKRFEVYAETSLSTKMAEVLVKVVIELLSILSIATKEVKRPRASEFSTLEILHKFSLTFLQRFLLRTYWG